MLVNTGKGDRKWFLVVDDDPEFREMVCVRLGMAFGKSIQIVEASDGMDATNRIPFTAFDCIISDLNMPRKEGRAFVSSARQSPLNQHTPIIIVSGDPKPEIEKEFEFVYMLEKPLDFDAFIKLVEAQVSLGKTDERMAADLLNGFIEAVRHFFNGVVDAPVKLLEPTPKAKGAAVEGDYLRIVDFKSGKAQSRFVFGLSEKTLQTAGQKVSGAGQEEDFLKICEVAGRIIFQTALKKVGNPEKIKVLEVQTIKNQDSAVLKEIKKKPGIHIPMKSRLGSAHLYALW